MTESEDKAREAIGLPPAPPKAPSTFLSRLGFMLVVFIVAHVILYWAATTLYDLGGYNLKAFVGLAATCISIIIVLNKERP